jgi:hypothetical protein
MWKTWSFVIFGILSLVAAGLIFFYFKNKQIQNNKVALTAPKELSINFDATVNSPKFSIQSVNLEDKTLSLKTVYPYISEAITSKITCREGDIKISSKSNQTFEDISLDTLFQKAQETEKEYMIFSGLCSDITCSEINRECYLYIGL